MICAYMCDMNHRAKLLMRSVSIKELNASGDAKEADRWMTGEVMPEIGQLSPGYEIADAKLQGRSGE
jgi:prophage antirepressor-like protein